MAEANGANATLTLTREQLARVVARGWGRRRGSSVV
jgi:hypothetical protein